MKQGIPYLKYNQWRIVVLEEGTRFMGKKRVLATDLNLEELHFREETKIEVTVFAQRLTLDPPLKLHVF